MYLPEHSAYKQMNQLLLSASVPQNSSKSDQCLKPLNQGIANPPATRSPRKLITQILQPKHAKPNQSLHLPVTFHSSCFASPCFPFSCFQYLPFLSHFPLPGFHYPRNSDVIKRISCWVVVLGCLFLLRASRQWECCLEGLREVQSKCIDRSYANCSAQCNMLWDYHTISNTCITRAGEAKWWSWGTLISTCLFLSFRQCITSGFSI